MSKIIPFKRPQDGDATITIPLRLFQDLRSSVESHGENLTKCAAILQQIRAQTRVFPGEIRHEHS